MGTEGQHTKDKMEVATRFGVVSSLERRMEGKLVDCETCEWETFKSWSLAGGSFPEGNSWQTWSLCVVDHEGELETMRGYFGPVEAGIQVQRMT